MDAKLTWIGIIFVIAALLGVLYFTFEQERKKKIVDARRRRQGFRD